MVEILTFPQENSEILTPEKVRAENAPTQLWVVTKKYGETLSTLKPGFEKEATKIEGMYDIEVPDAVLDFCKEINSLGGRALLVGGCVRDAIISAEREGYNLVPKDLDVEIYGLSPETLRLILETKFGNVHAEGEAFKVFKARVPGMKECLDVSMPRRESKTGAKHQDFNIEGDPTMTISEASLRRDLTINSLAYNPLTKTVYDAYNGVEHIKKGIIEVTNEKAFQEDPLRVYRIMQFAARFEFEISENVLRLCREMVQRGDLDNLPFERVTDEFSKMLTKGRKPSLGLEFARKVGILERYFPEVDAMVGLQQDETWHPEGDTWRHTLQAVDAAVDIAKREGLSEDDTLALTLATLTHDLGKSTTTEFKDGRWRAHGHESAGVLPAREFLDKFVFPNNIKNKVAALVPEHLAPKYYWEQEVKHGIDMKNAINRLAVRLDRGGANIYMLSLLAEADQRGRNPDTRFSEPLNRNEVGELEEWQIWLNNKAVEQGVAEKPPARLISGNDVLNKLPGKRGGVWLGCVLEAVHQDQLDDLVRSFEEALQQSMFYEERFSKVVGALVAGGEGDERTVWERLRGVEDPRAVLATNSG